ncbi:MAG: AAA family ATPase [Caldilinea sp.]
MTANRDSQPFIRKVTIRNYKSIAACQVELQNLMFLVGRNGAGKSNFLDALRFVADALRTSLDHALRDRGTIKEVRRRSDSRLMKEAAIRSVVICHRSFRGSPPQSQEPLALKRRLSFARA